MLHLAAAITADALHLTSAVLDHVAGRLSDYVRNHHPCSVSHSQ